MEQQDLKIAIISDTHGLIRPNLRGLLKGVDYIIHAGDLGGMQVFTELNKIAPVTAVCGNVDYDLEDDFPQYELFELGGKTFFLLHNLCQMDIDPVVSKCDLVIHGHTHQPEIREKNNILYINPGSVGPRRALCPVSMVMLQIVKGEISAEIVLLEAN